MELAGVVAVIDDLARDDELVLGVNGDLHVIARHRLAVLRQQPGVGIRPRQLALAAVGKRLEIGRRLRALRHESRHLLRNVAAATIVAVIARRQTRRLLGVVRIQRAAIPLNVAVKRGKLFD
jgi:hypothetical protein